MSIWLPYAPDDTSGGSIGPNFTWRQRSYARDCSRLESIIFTDLDLIDDSVSRWDSESESAIRSDALVELYIEERL